eukprot:maker-scaffold955_size76929-snap-gene-0.14 protein:Tk07418 transcript:maker-scaffold955_size76929-snap-gene-0.14-mRNA-1 annotation:"hypothetical protein BRAFLDRAFT_254371"
MAGLIGTCVVQILGLIRAFLDIATGFIYKSLYENSHRTLPPLDNPILLLPATDLARKIRSRELRSTEVLEAYIQRIKTVNPTLNCIVDTRFHEALAEAREADALLADPSTDKEALAQSKPYLGVPFTTKDCFAVQGLSWTSGLLARKGQKASLDADTVQLMREAGAIPMGVTNVSELCMWWESSNNVYGRTNNFYHNGRIVGGSSGGEGCAISSGASIFGIGSDVGGSIRMPAFFNGIFGHKPSSGAVSNYGQLPTAGPIVNTFLATGPMCRYAQDLMPMFKVLTGPKKAQELGLDKKVDIKKLRIFYMVDDGGHPAMTPVDSDLRQVQKELVQKLEQVHGLQAKRVELKHFYYSGQIWSHMMSSDASAPSFASELKEKAGEINPYWELLKWMCFKSSVHTLPALALAITDKFVGPEASDHATFLNKYRELKQELQALLGDDGILLYPSHPTPAPYHGQPLLRPFNFSYTGIFNVLKVPVTQCPLGLSSQGVPMGIQVVGGDNCDRSTLALALEIEKMFGGW